MKLCHLLWTSPKTRLQYQKNLPYLTEVQWDISDLHWLIIEWVCLFAFLVNRVHISMFPNAMDGLLVQRSLNRQIKDRGQFVVSGADPGFKEGVHIHVYKGVGVRFADFISFSINKL